MCLSLLNLDKNLLLQLRHYSTCKGYGNNHHMHHFQSENRIFVIYAAVNGISNKMQLWNLLKNQRNIDYQPEASRLQSSGFAPMLESVGHLSSNSYISYSWKEHSTLSRLNQILQRRLTEISWCRSLLNKAGDYTASDHPTSEEYRYAILVGWSHRNCSW